MSTESFGTKTFTAGGTIPQFARVKLSAANTVVVSVAADKAAYLGVAQTGAASGETLTVAFKGGYRTFKLIASEAMAVNAVIYGDADGEIQDTSNGNPIGTALEAATADQDIIECILLDQVAVV